MIKKKPALDFIISICLFLLVIISVLSLATASIPLSLKETGTSYYYLIHQVLFGLIPGLILGYIAFKIPLNFLKKYSFHIFALSLVLMFLVICPFFSKTSGGATRWIEIGPLSFQPCEFFKLAVILYLAAWLSSKEKKNFTAFLFIIGISALALILQSDLSTLIILAIISLAIYFCANTPIKHTLATIAIGAAGAIALIKVTPYRMERLMVFLNPDTDPLGSGYHIKQALISVGSGGFAGSGIGLSVQKFGFLPETISDSIFAIYAEETGFLGCLFLISVFSVLVFRIFKIAMANKDYFKRLLLVGIGTWIIIQTFINMGAMIGILPLTGTPLPFISYGGTHLIAELIAIGLVFNVSKNLKF